ncbi:MAG: PD-(D/E)XK nuclease family protein [Desulfobacterales bacterium]|nr:PD-(D/E)XK nuclease family protein [Pseudomonadota bacterium]MBU4355041.1 PD-(D/E)XK nuclease family protein [Pseudomonadota bacterium]MCG2773929.1 PD-(D/E)XK nuclease family protein [Desulfobacterales bacterium]
MTAARFFTSGAALQDYLLGHAGPGALGIVPHQRLAHQVWHRQRLAALEAGRPAWEPLPLLTLNAWWSELFKGLWPEAALAPALVRLARWRQALQTAPPPPGPTPDLAWAQALDEAHTLLCRYAMAGGDARPTVDYSPLITWRRRVTRTYVDLLRQEGWLSPGELPAYLTYALRDGRIKLPPRVLVAGLETPAPLEELWLQEVSRRTQVVHLQVRGDLDNVRQAVALPDPAQELNWVAAQLVELARSGLPLHRLAVTAPAIGVYTPQLRRVLAELLGPPQSPDGWAYNFSQGPNLSEVPLFQAALLPLTFIAARERREDLVSLLLSPYYGEVLVHGRAPAQWDRAFRERRVDQGWDQLRRAVLRSRPPEAETAVLERLDRIWNSLRLSTAPAGQWGHRLRAAWQELGFPRGLGEADREPWDRLVGLLPELETALGSEGLKAGEFLEWLKIGAQRVILPGPGIQAAGIQVLGLLEMRGLDFSHVFCLGMNSGTLPAPPRPLPLLSAAEKRLVLGGTYPSQHHFAAELFHNLLGAAPNLTLTRPRSVDQEEQVSTPLYLGEWSQAEMPVLTTPNPAWLRSPAIQAVFHAPAAPAVPGYPDPPLPFPLPGEISLTQVSTALACPCRFLLENLLKIRELPEIEPGLDPRERGQLLHEVLARFTTAFKEILATDQAWDQERARELLQEAVRQVLAPSSGDLHWQAEADRWLGDPGLLWEWLSLERQRYEAGWRWQGAEVAFNDLQGQNWPFTLRGRIDRLDYHPEQSDLVVWDYKSGEIPKKGKVLDDLEESQLPCYLLAVQQGRVPVHQPVANLRAGFIGLKSPRSHHLKHEDFGVPHSIWQEAAAAFAAKVTALGRRLTAGNFRPDPYPAPEGKKLGACQYCPYALVCGFAPAPAAEEEEV